MRPNFFAQYQKRPSHAPGPYHSERKTENDRELWRGKRNERLPPHSSFLIVTGRNPIFASKTPHIHSNWVVVAEDCSHYCLSAGYQRVKEKLPGLCHGPDCTISAIREACHKGSGHWGVWGGIWCCPPDKSEPGHGTLAQFRAEAPGTESWAPKHVEQPTRPSCSLLSCSCQHFFLFISHFPLCFSLYFLLSCHYSLSSSLPGRAVVYTTLPNYSASQISGCIFFKT